MAYTQDERMCQVSSPLGDNVLLLAELNAQESISQPFFFDLQLLSEKDDVNFGALIGKPISIRMTLANGNERYFHGIVSRFSQGPSVGDFTSYRAELVPFVWLLRRRSGCRIFQHKSAPDIIKAILAETGFSDYEFQLSGEHPEREYCVQFRESDLAFISRLSEEEGISYFFKHSDKAHTLVFFDSPSANPPCTGQTSVVYTTAEDPGPGGAIVSWQKEQEFAVGKWAHTDYNFEDPSMNLLASASTAHPMGGNDKFEVYQFPGEFTSLAEGERRAKLRMQAEEAAAVCARAHSTCAAFTPGFRFDLQGHSRSDYNGAYLITSVTHRASQDVGDGGRHSSYANDLTCLPYSIPYRPTLRTPKPLIYGVQTATVVGAAGKEIDVDSHGRVVVQFHWDREGKKDENSSCRVRVSQNWAGKGWGLVANPRIGQEVIVQFVDGDPDRPIIVGRVYNGEQTMGFGIPASDTQTGFISRSSPGGSAENANIWRFEDKKGEEQVFIHAEKNQDIEVEHDESQWVGNDRRTTIDHDESFDVKNDRSKSVGQNETLSVHKNQTEDVGENQTLNVGKDQTITIGASRSLSVTKSESISITEKRTETVGQDEEVEISKERKHTIGESDHLSVGKKLTIDVGDAISIVTGEASITLEKDGTITIKGKDITIDAGGKIAGKASGELSMKGSTISQN